MVRPPFAVLEPEQIRLSQRHTPPRRHLGSGHVLHHARRFQSVLDTRTLLAEDLQERQRALPDEVTTGVVYTVTNLLTNCLKPGRYDAKLGTDYTADRVCSKDFCQRRIRFSGIPQIRIVGGRGRSRTWTKTKRGLATNTFSCVP